MENTAINRFFSDLINFHPDLTLTKDNIVSNKSSELNIAAAGRRHSVIKLHRMTVFSDPDGQAIIRLYNDETTKQVNLFLVTSVYDPAFVVIFGNDSNIFQVTNIDGEIIVPNPDQLNFCQTELSIAFPCEYWSLSWSQALFEMDVARTGQNGTQASVICERGTTELYLHLKHIPDSVSTDISKAVLIQYADDGRQLIAQTVALRRSVAYWPLPMKDCANIAIALYQ